MIEFNRKTFRDIDWLLLLAPVALTLFGCLGIYSTAPNPADFVKKQVIALFIGLLIAFSIMFTDYRKIIKEIAPFLYGAVIFLLILVSLSAGYFPNEYSDQQTSVYWVAGVAATLLFFLSIVAHHADPPA